MNYVEAASLVEWYHGITRLPAVPPALLAFPSKVPRFARPRKPLHRLNNVANQLTALTDLPL